MKEGQATKQHLEHLDQVAAFLAQGWAARQGQCPTCGAEHAAHGGIQKVVKELKTKVGTAREELLREYRALDDKVKALQKSMQARGESPCPLSQERQALLRETVAWMLPQPSLERQLKDPALRTPFLDALRKLSTRPPLPDEIDPRSEAQRLAQMLSVRFKEARNIFLDPDHWKPVQSALTTKLANIMSEHLPGTLQRLWTELTLNLTAAPWFLRERPAFDVAHKRGSRRASVRLDQRLGRYILNHAETQALGLGWFFTRYLTHGRFRGQFLVMDDPAEQLDQTSYRDLCRLSRAFLRLHAVRSLRFRLVLFLHQQDRALDAARATGGQIHLLNWTPEQQGELRTVQLSSLTDAPLPPSAQFKPQPVAA